MNNLPLSTDAGDLFKLAFDLAPAGMLSVDASGHILLANLEVERLFGYGRGELIGLHIGSLVPERVRAGHEGTRRAFFGAPSTRAMGAGRDLYGLRKDGTEVPVEIGLNPVRTPDGIVVIASIVDISARRESERKVREAEERAQQSRKLESLGTLAGGIAHDFNNVLLAIVGYTELVERRCADRPEVVEDLGHVLRAADRGRQLIQRILAFSRQNEANRVPLRLERTTREVLELLRASLPTTIEIRSTFDPNTPVVLSDETQIHQIVMNLATNAAHAMEDGGVLDVRLEPQYVDRQVSERLPELKPGLHARLVVSDTGHGIPADVRARIFEPFFTTKPVGKGTGLGLSVILGIVRSLDGAVEVESEPGRGTRVSVWLPAHRAVAPKVEPLAREGGDVGGLHVLFVEDEAPLAAMERRQLESLGFRVTVHTSSIEALEDFRSRPEAFDLLITDNSMPRMTGLQLAGHVTGMRPSLPVLMISGYAESADPDVLRTSGIRAVLRKPHTSRELGEALRRMLEGGPAA